MRPTRFLPLCTALLLAGLALWDLNDSVRAAAPSITTEPVSPASISPTSAVFSATATANGQTTTTWFEYGTNISYGSFSASNTVASIGINVLVAAGVSNLVPNTLYHVRAAARNNSGSAFGQDQIFATPVPAPTVATLAAATVNSNSAVLNGSFNPNGFPGTGWFDWGTNASYGHSSTQVDLGSGTSPITNSFPLASLLSGVTYHFRASGSNSSGIVRGTDKTFRTSPGYFLVTTLADAGSGSLRQIISNSLSGDFISFATNGTIVLTNGELLITNSVTIAGPGATNLAISGNNQSRVFEISSNAAVLLSGLTIRDGHAPNGVNGTTNSPSSIGADGGGALNWGTLTFNNCIVVSNSAGDGGTGSAAAGSSDSGGDGSGGGSGGGIFSGGTLVLLNCTLNGNKSGHGGNGGSGTRLGAASGNGGFGGHGGGIFSTGSLTLSLCTAASNFAGWGGSQGAVGAGGIGGDGGSGGGLYSAGNLLMIASTVCSNAAGNRAPNAVANGDGGGLYIEYSANATLRSTIVALNAVGTFGVPGYGFDAFGSYVSSVFNLVGRVEGSTGFTNGVNGNLCGSAAAPLDPVLGPLTNNGGATLTMALTPASPALNAGDDSLLAAPYNLTADQCGFERKSGAHVDIGAFELDVSSMTPPGVVTLGASSGPVNPATRISSLTFNGSVNPAGTPATAWFEFGSGLSYSGFSTTNSVGSGTTNISVAASITGVAAGFRYHYRLAASSPIGTAYGSDQAVTTSSPFPVGDFNGDGIVDQNELDTVLSNYWPNSPWVYMTNTAGLGTSNVTFALTNASAWLFTVESSTNLTNWQSIGSAYPLYQFFDPSAASNAPQRFYRLRWP